jgi:hypothetical protein
VTLYGRVSDDMPYNPPVFRPRSAPSRREQNQALDRYRRKDQPWRKWYSLRVWQDIRRAQLTSEPLCQRCKPKGLIVGGAVAA